MDFGQQALEEVDKLSPVQLCINASHLWCVQQGRGCVRRHNAWLELHEGKTV